MTLEKILSAERITMVYFRSTIGRSYVTVNRSYALGGSRRNGIYMSMEIFLWWFPHDHVIFFRVGTSETRLFPAGRRRSCKLHRQFEVSATAHVMQILW